jgi:hypothetical protein
MQFKKSLLSLSLVLVSSLVLAQTPKYSNEFLTIGLEADPWTFGAVVAGVDDATSAVWNPAGEQGEGNLQIAAMHAELFADFTTMQLWQQRSIQPGRLDFQLSVLEPMTFRILWI